MHQAETNPLQRGMHDIENELIFRSNDKFVFHDSPGFEAGCKDEFLRMKEFIGDRAKTKRLHAIWYRSKLRYCALIDVF